MDEMDDINGPDSINFLLFFLKNFSVNGRCKMYERNATNGSDCRE